jgi:crotonobetainyl-CoA:carnitine CoA-transferase CaiB-like acyl-CoA transferase
MSREARFATTDLQVENLAQIRDRFSPIVAGFSTDECVKRLFAVDLLCSPVNDLGPVVDHPQTRHNGTIWDVPVPGRGPVRLAGNPVRLSRTPAGIHHEPSAIGAHSDEVLTSFGFSKDEIEQLRVSGAVR